MLPDTGAGRKSQCAPFSQHSRCIKPFKDRNAFLKGRFIGCTMIVQTFFNMPVKDSKYTAPLTVKNMAFAGHHIGSILFTILPLILCVDHLVYGIKPG